MRRVVSVLKCCLLFDINFAYFPTFLSFQYLNSHMFAVLFIADTFRDTPGQIVAPRHSVSAQFALPVESRCLAVWPFGLSDRHDDVGDGTDEVATSDRDGERSLDCFWHTSVDDEAAVDTLTLRLWRPAPGSGCPRVHVSLCQDKACVVVVVVQVDCLVRRYRGVQNRERWS